MPPCCSQRWNLFSSVQAKIFKQKLVFTCFWVPHNSYFAHLIKTSNIAQSVFLSSPPWVWRQLWDSWPTGHPGEKKDQIFAPGLFLTPKISLFTFRRLTYHSYVDSKMIMFITRKISDTTSRLLTWSCFVTTAPVVSPPAVVMVLYRWYFNIIFAFVLLLVCVLFCFLFTPCCGDGALQVIRFTKLFTSAFYVIVCLCVAALFFIRLLLWWWCSAVELDWSIYIICFQLFVIVCFLIFSHQPTQLLAAGRSPGRHELTALLASSFPVRLKKKHYFSSHYILSEHICWAKGW